MSRRNDKKKSEISHIHVAMSNRSSKQSHRRKGIVKIDTLFKPNHYQSVLNNIMRKIDDATPSSPSSMNYASKSAIQVRQFNMMDASDKTELLKLD